MCCSCLKRFLGRFCVQFIFFQKLLANLLGLLDLWTVHSFYCLIICMRISSCWLLLHFSWLFSHQSFSMFRKNSLISFLIFLWFCLCSLTPAFIVDFIEVCAFLKTRRSVFALVSGFELSRYLESFEINFNSLSIASPTSSLKSTFLSILLGRVWCPHCCLKTFYTGVFCPFDFSFSDKNDHLMVCPTFGSCVNVAVYVFIVLPGSANVLQLFKYLMAQNSKNNKPFSFLIPVPKFLRIPCHSFSCLFDFQVLRSSLHI